MKNRRFDLILIDSGVDLYDDEQIDYEEIDLFPSGLKRASAHGTSTLRTINSISGGVKVLSLKITNEQEESSSGRLIEALEYARKIECKVIAIALSTRSHNEKLEKLCRILDSEGKIIIAPLFNGLDESYPACYESVIGIRGVRYRNRRRFKFIANEKVQGFFDSSDAIHVINDESYCFSGNSRACALATGKVLNITRKKPLISKFEVESELEEESRQVWDAFSLYESEVRRVVFTEISKIVVDVDIDTLIRYKFTDPKIGLSKKDFLKLFDSIYTEFPFISNYHASLDNMVSYEELVRVIGRSYFNEACSDMD